MKRQQAIHHETLETRTLFSYPVSIGSALYDSASKVVSMPDGGTVVAGLFTGTADFDPTSRQVNCTAEEDRADVFIARYSATGALRWVRQFSSDAGKIKADKGIDTPVDPERASQFDLGTGIQPRDLGIYLTGLSVDTQGSIYFAGSFRGSVNFLPAPGNRTLTSSGGNNFINAYFGRLNGGDGSLSFVRQITSPFTGVINAMTLDASNNVYITGYFTRSSNFNVTGGTLNLTTRGREDIFTAKYDPVGRVQWVNNVSTDETDRVKRSAGSGIAVDANNNVYVTGSFSGETRFVPSIRTGATTLDPVDHTDTFVEKLNAAGKLTWVKGFGGKGYDGGVTLALSITGQNIFVGSYFEDTVDVNPGPRAQFITATPESGDKSPKRTDLLLSNFRSTDGLLVTAGALVAGPGWETLGELRVDNANNLYATGAFYDRADFDPGAGTFNLTSTIGIENFHDTNDGDRDYSYDVFISKFNSAGVLQFAKNFGSASDDFGTSMALDLAQRPVVAGQFRGTYFFPSSSSKFRPYGGQDAFVAIFDTDGTVLPG